VFALIAAVVATSATPHGWEVRNEYWLVRGRGAVIESAVADPNGRAHYTARLAGRLYAGDSPSFTGTAEERGARTVLVRGSSFLAQPRTTEVRERDTAVRLEPGHVLAQSFSAPAGMARVEASLPTWYATDSSATLTLRKGSADGEVVASRRLEAVVDNGWAALTFPPHGAGVYWLALSEPSGTVGWWAKKGNPLESGRAYIDGKVQPDMDFQLRFTAYDEASGDLKVSLDGDTLTVEPSLTGLRMRLETPWRNSGYGLADVARHWFRRLITDRGQYLPVEQLKRRDRLDFAMGASKWVHIGGALGADWHLEPFAGAVDFAMSGNTLTLLLGERLSVKVMKAGWVPDFLPRFEASDAKFARTLNDFLWERALSWPLDPGLPDWMEWLALIRDWMNLPGYLERERAHLLTYRMTDDGYLYTWGDKPEWPFPDNEKYDARHFTTNAMFILGCWRYYCWSHDYDFLRRNAERLRRAMDFQLRELKGADGMLVMASPDHDGTPAGVPSNYWDDIPFGYKSAYENIYFCASLGAMADMEQAIGDAARAKYLRDLKEKAVARYRQEFWNEKDGRFVGCIDRNGVVRDYGFAYVNLEAMAYGLATQEQARRICRWLETQPTQTGKADTYSAYRFAPRVNTLDCSGWWYLHGKAEIPSQPFGKHCENGGAILYTSGFDICSRARYLGADDAFRRLREIVRRYQEPDKLCGGSPLFHGEINGWEVGTDIPFPESGIAPASFLYAFLGVQATPQGLVIRPNLPKALKWAGVRGLVYRGLPLGIRVTNTSVEVRSEGPGQGFRLQKRLRKGESFVLGEMPGGLRFPALKPRAGWRAKWLWHAGKQGQAGVIFARKSFEIQPPLPLDATLWVAADNTFTVFVNGKQVASGAGWQSAHRADIRPLLRTGSNVIAVRAENAGGPAGLLVELRVGRLNITTDKTWRTSDKEEDGWTQLTFDESHWVAAEEIGPVPISPWGEVSNGPP